MHPHAGLLTRSAHVCQGDRKGHLNVTARGETVEARARRLYGIARSWRCRLHVLRDHRVLVPHVNLFRVPILAVYTRETDELVIFEHPFCSPQYGVP
jgi:hypothetical protein